MTCWVPHKTQVAVENLAFSFLRSRSETFFHEHPVCKTSKYVHLTKSDHSKYKAPHPGSGLTEKWGSKPSTPKEYAHSWSGGWQPQGPNEAQHTVKEEKHGLGWDSSRPLFPQRCLLSLSPYPLNQICYVSCWRLIALKKITIQTYAKSGWIRLSFPFLSFFFPSPLSIYPFRKPQLLSSSNSFSPSPRHRAYIFLKPYHWILIIIFCINQEP